MPSSETIVISVGGSLIVPAKGGGAPDAVFLKSFRSFIERGVREERRFVCITGGGRTTRTYQKAASAVFDLNDEDLDWLGIHATRLNAHLVRTILRDSAHPVIVTNPDDVLDVPQDASVIVAAGYRPGSSTDLRAVQIATHLGAHRVVNLSDIDYAYTADPDEDPSAAKIEAMGWNEFLALVPAEWSPGLSSPFDPVASREAQKNNIEVAIINGNKLEEVEKYLKGEKFIGSIIN